MVDANAGGKVPLSFWVIAELGLVWNSFGAFDYLKTRMRDMEYLTSVTGSESLAGEMLAMIDTMPLWAQALWGLGVWSSVLGSILMLIRSRHAVSAFLLVDLVFLRIQLLPQNAQIVVQPPEGVKYGL